MIVLDGRGTRLKPGFGPKGLIERKMVGKIIVESVNDTAPTMVKTADDDDEEEGH
jgi:hypothetical protein